MSVAPATLDSPDENRISQRRHAVFVLYGLSAFWGVAQLVASDNPLLNVVSAFTFAAAATMWFSIDRRIVARPPVPVLSLLFFLTWPIASLLHLLVTRGLRGCGYWLVHASGLFATMCLTFFPAMLLLHWAGVLDLDAMADQ